MLRFITLLSGIGLVLLGISTFLYSASSRYGADPVDLLLAAGAVIGGLATFVFAIRPNATSSDRLISAWMDLKRAEMQAKRDAIKRGGNNG